MAKVSAEEVKYLGRLARIGLAEADIKRMQPELQTILAYVAKLQAVDTKNVQPTNQVTGLVDVWRPDQKTSKKWNRSELLKNTPQTKDGFIKVNKVL